MFVMIAVQAQELTGFVKDSMTHKPLDCASVVLMDRSGNPLTFMNTKENGGFSLKTPKGTNAAKLQVTYLGYTPKSVPIGLFKNGETIYLPPNAISLREVEIKSKRLQQKSDTLVYSVAGFRHKQDRSIADVIAKMPGLAVSEKGTITYQGKPINNFYIEGMDLLGKKYSMASENLSAKKVKKVEVFRNHQSIKALKGIQFSNQAAINLVLEDDAKEVLNGMAEIGMGASTPKGIGEDFLRNTRIIAMLFGHNHQSLTMHKSNNAGKDIQHEIRDLTSSSQLESDNKGWVDNIGLSAPNIGLGRYNFNNTHIAATNWLFKTKRKAELRLQGTYLFDKTIGYKKDITTFTNINNLPIMTEETHANLYRRELDVELQYKENKDSLYVNNVLKTSINWNESFANTTLNGTNTRQAVEPRKRHLRDEFSVIKKFRNNKSMDVNASFDYLYLPGKLLTLTDSVPQSLNVKTLSSLISTRFRHRVWGMYISYDAQMKYHRDDFELNDHDKVSYQQAELKLTPRMSMEKHGLSLSCSLPIYVSSYRLAGAKEHQAFVSPYVSLGYQCNGYLSLLFNYSHQKSCYDVGRCLPLAYYRSYATRIEGNGKLCFIRYDNVDGKLEFSNPNIGLFFNARGSYTLINDVPLFGYRYENNVYSIVAVPQKANNRQVLASAELSKAFGYGKLTMTIGADIMRHDYKAWISEQVADGHVDNYSAKFQVAFMPTPLFSLEGKSAFHESKYTNKTFQSLSSSSLRSFKHNLTMNFMPGNFLFAWTHELYHSNDHSVSCTYFSDLKCTYTHKRYEISFMANNIFGSKKYERNVVYSSTIQYTVNSLRPREFMLEVSFSL